jgi:hypothetical protein
MALHTYPHIKIRYQTLFCFILCAEGVDIISFIIKKYDYGDNGPTPGSPAAGGMPILSGIKTNFWVS